LQDTIQVECYLVIAGIERRPFDAVVVHAGGQRTQVDVLFAGIVVDPGMQVSVSVIGAEEEVAVTGKSIRAEANVLEGGAAKGGHCLDDPVSVGGH
jgi:hypothetical protein